MRAFVQALRGQMPPLTSANDALESHLLGFAAETARLGEAGIDLQNFRENTLKNA